MNLEVFLYEHFNRYASLKLEIRVEMAHEHWRTFTLSLPSRRKVLDCLGGIEDMVAALSRKLGIPPPPPPKGRRKRLPYVRHREWNHNKREELKGRQSTGATPKREGRQTT